MKVSYSRSHHSNTWKEIEMVILDETWKINNSMYVLTFLLLKMKILSMHTHVNKILIATNRK